MELFFKSNHCWVESFSRRIIYALLYETVFMKWLAGIGRGSSVANSRGGVGGILREPRRYLKTVIRC